MGTRLDDHGTSVIRYFENAGFKLLSGMFDIFCKPEIWLIFARSSDS